MILVRSRAHFITALVLLLVLAACGGEDEPEPMTPPAREDAPIVVGDSAAAAVDAAATDTEASGLNDLDDDAHGTAGSGTSAGAPGTGTAGAGSPGATPGDGDRGSEARAEGTGGTGTASFTGTRGVSRRERSIPAVAILDAVRTGRHEDFDRVVFEFRGQHTPGYYVEYMNRPVRECGSGETVDVKGDGVLMIRMPAAQAHTEEGRNTLEARALSTNLPQVQALSLYCDFEAELGWAVGVSSRAPYRVLELNNPPRIVVDVRH